MKYFSPLLESLFEEADFYCRVEKNWGRFHFRFGKRVDKWRHEGLSPVSVLRGAGVQGGHSLRTEYQWSGGRVSVFWVKWVKLEKLGWKIGRPRLFFVELELPRYGLWNVNNTGGETSVVEERGRKWVWNRSFYSSSLYLLPRYEECECEYPPILIFFLPTRPACF